MRVAEHVYVCKDHHKLVLIQENKVHYFWLKLLIEEGLVELIYTSF
jgi:hypothetical protein